MPKIYSYKDTEFSYDQLLEKYGDDENVQKAIAKFGFKEISNNEIKKPGKRKSVAKEDAVATAKSTVSKSVKPSTVSPDNIWGETKTQPEFITKLQKVTQPKTIKPTLASVEERESGQVPPNQDKSWIPSIADYKKKKTDEIGIPSEFVNKALSTPESIKYNIQKNDLDLKNPYIYYSTSKSGDTFVDETYNAPKLKSLGVDPDDFDGFLNKNGYSNDFKKNIENGIYDYSSNQKLTLEQVNFMKEKALDKYLQFYLKDKDEKTNLYLQLKNKEKSPETSFDEIKKNTKQVTNWDENKKESYRAEMFPTLKKLETERTIKEKEILQHLQTRNKVQDVLEDTYGAGKGLVNSMWNSSVSAIATAGEFLGLQAGAEKWRGMLEYGEYTDPDTRGFAFIEGKGINKNGIDYRVDNQGNIYNTTHGFNIAGIVPDSEYKSLKEAINKEGVDGWSISPRGAAKQTGEVLGAMVPQIFLTRGVGMVTERALAAAAGFNTVAEYKNMVALSEAIGGKAVGKLKIPITKDVADAVIAQSAFGYSNGYEQTLKASRDAGIDDAASQALATVAANQMALLYAATAPISPQTKAKDAIFGSIEKRLLKEALDQYKTDGVKGFINTLKSNASKIAQKATTFAEEGGKETIQENVQQKGENELVNKNVNELANQNILKDTYTYQDFVNTSGLSFLTGGMIATAKIPNFKTDPKQRLIDLYTLGQNTIELDKNLDNLVQTKAATPAEAEALRKDVVATSRQLYKIPKDVDATTSLELTRKLQEVEDLEESKTKIAKPFHKSIDEKINGLNTEITDIYDKRLDVEVERLKTLTEQADTVTFGKGAINNGQGTSVIDTKEEAKQLAEDWFINNGREAELYKQDENKKFVLDENGKKIKIVDFSLEPAILLPNGQVIINREIARKVDEGASVGRHELLHKILKSQFNDDAQSLKLLNQFKSILSAKENRIIEQRIAEREYSEKYLSENRDEYLTQFFEALETGEITATDATFKSMWISIFRPIYQKLGFGKLDFNSGNDIYQFLKDYHINSKSGKLTERQKNLLKAGEQLTGNTVFSKAKVAEVQAKIDKLEDQYDAGEIEDYAVYENALENLEKELEKAKAIPEVEVKPKVEKPKVQVTAEDEVKEIINNEKGTISSDKVQKIYEEKGLNGADEIIKLFRPITNKIVNKRKDAPGFDEELLRDEIETGEGGIIYLIRSYKPEKGVPLAAYINKQLPLRAIAASRRILEGEFKKDVTEEKGIMAEETVIEAKEKPKYKNALESKVFPSEVLKTATNKIITIVRMLKSRIDAPVTLNRTVTPLISEIKGEIGKLLDIDIKTMLGGKKDGVLRKELLRNKRYILENMTTTWLMGKDGQGGIPQAIQKQVDGKWVNFPDWVGQKIDREKTTTDQAGRTSGAELVRRLPNVVNNISDEVFLAQIIGPDGNPIRGRKESLSKAMSEEGALDIIKEDLENEGPIYNALKVNQERLGVEINETLKIEFNRQAEQGNVKFTKASNKNTALFLLEEGNWRKDYPEYKAFLKTLSAEERKSLNYFINRTKSLIDKYEEVWNKNLGVRYEKDTYSKLRKQLKDYLGKVGIGLEEDIPDRFNSVKPDLVFVDKKTGNRTVVELKSNLRDPMGSSSNGNFINKNIDFTKEFSGLDILKEALNANSERSKFINKLKQLIKEGSKEVRITEKGIQISNALYNELDRTGTSTYAEIPIQAIADINPGKDILQIASIGAFAFPGSKVAKSGIIPVLSGKMYVSTDFRTSAAGKGFRTLIERAYFNLDPTFNQKTDINLDDKPEEFLDAIRYSKTIEENTKNIITANAVAGSYKQSKTVKGISVFDFDDTIGLTKSNVLYTMPNGTKGKLNAEEFAKDGASLLEAGAEFDFSEFSKVTNGKPGPMVEKMKKMIGKFGPDNFFILTARPADSAGPIHQFLSSIGIDIPLENITGLGNSAAQAKADWMTAKAAEGYNDFYFADDAIQNVEAVKKALNIPGVDSKVQQAMAKFSLTSKQDLKWNIQDWGSSAFFNINNKDYSIALIDTGKFNYSRKEQKILDNLIKKYNLEDEEANLLGSLEGGTLNLAFGDENQSVQITGAKDAFEVFGTVINGVLDYIKNNETTAVIFTAKEPSRKKLYNAMAAVYANKLGWNAFYEDGVYIISKYPVRETASSFDSQSKPVREVLNVVDVKSKIQQNKAKFSKTISPEFNKIIQQNKGVESYKVFSDIVAKRRGAGKNLFDIYVPASAADFELLLYNFLGKGRLGEEQKRFFENALLKPYANGNDLMDAARQSIKKDYKALTDSFPNIRKKIEKLTPDGDFTYDQAIRVAMWADAGIEIPGLSQRDANKLTSLVNNDPELNAFKAGLIVMGRQGPGWIEPVEHWDSSTIIADLHNITEGKGRKKFLAEFIENSEAMFGKFENGKLVGENINKVQAIYGTDVREAIEDVLYRMINGKNRTQGQGKETSMWSNWVNGSTGAIMFLNVRSAALQLIGSVNFLNLKDNNPVAAAAAFANQKQYWKDFARIWNSDKMKERRGGLKEDVAAAEIANAAASSKNKVGSVLSYLLKIGYTPTQMADSFAIASGGAPFYRNRIKSYLKEGLTEQEAEVAAWNDFTKVSDETQQSGDPRDISKQQASGAGRLLLTFQNTAMQQSRIVKKAVLDLKNRRGNDKTNVAKIAYYLAIQNTMFAALQQGLFAVAFGYDDEDKEKPEKEKKLNEKLADVADGVIDTILRGTGFTGGIIATLKNMTKKYLEERDKNFKADYAKVMLEGANISPPIGSKLRKLYSGLQQTKFEKDLIQERGWGIMQDGRVHLGPMYGISGKIVESFTNVPMDRLATKIENASQAMNSQNQAWQRVMVGLGWNPRSIGIEESKGDIEIKQNIKEERAWENKFDPEKKMEEKLNRKLRKMGE